MTNFLWPIFGILTIILLIIFWRKINAVWGGFTLGIIVGLIIAIIYLFRGKGFDWFVIGKSAILGAMIGFVAELLGKISDFFKNKK